MYIISVNLSPVKRARERMGDATDVHAPSRTGRYVAKCRSTNVTGILLPVLYARWYGLQTPRAAFLWQFRQATHDQIARIIIVIGAGDKRNDLVVGSNAHAGGDTRLPDALIHIARKVGAAAEACLLYTSRCV